MRLGYGLPLAAALLAAAIAHATIGMDLAVAVAALTGLWLGARLAGHLSRGNAAPMSDHSHTDFPSPSKERQEHA